MYNYFPPIFQYAKKIIHSSSAFFNVYLPIENVRISDGFEFESFSSPNYSKFAVKCNWNIKVPKIRTKFGFFLKKAGKFAVE